MAVYPVSIRRDTYRGRNASRLRKAAEYNRVAAKVEAHINQTIAGWREDEINTFYSATIARTLREDDQLVHDIVFSIDCGSNGVTIRKGNAERAWAKRFSGAA